MTGISAARPSLVATPLEYRERLASEAVAHIVDPLLLADACDPAVIARLAHRTLYADAAFYLIQKINPLRYAGEMILWMRDSSAHESVAIWRWSSTFNLIEADTRVRQVILSLQELRALSNDNSRCVLAALGELDSWCDASARVRAVWCLRAVIRQSMLQP